MPCSHSLNHSKIPNHNQIRSFSSIKIVPFKKKHIQFGWNLTQEENWITTVDELQDLLKFDPKGNFILECDGTARAMIFSTKYKEFTFIGNFIVEKEFRHKGLGRLLFSYAMNSLRSRRVKTIMLDSVPEAVPFYSSFGFKEICRSLRFNGKLPTLINPKPKNMHQITPDILESIINFDEQIFGSSRKILLKEIYNRNPSTCFYQTQNGQISSYIMVERRDGYFKIGPWIVSQNEPHPEDLLLYCIAHDQKSFNTSKISNISNISNTSNTFTSYVNIKLGVLERNTRAVNLLQKMGFKISFYAIRMIFGQSYPIMKNFNGIFAQAGPDRG
ncbi:MAG: GNAT family N-acetyltransferase [Candidatus Lokiarchaeota archaeon]|nr:GNAT family N-acetyltransferase [Candidatus Harpocratesius repetitus]